MVLKCLLGLIAHMHTVYRGVMCMCVCLCQIVCVCVCGGGLISAINVLLSSISAYYGNV